MWRDYLELVADNASTPHRHRISRLLYGRIVYGHADMLDVQKMVKDGMKIMILIIASIAVSLSGLAICIIGTVKKHEPAQDLGIFMSMIGLALAILHILG